MEKDKEMTPEEIRLHEEAEKIRAMSDQQLAVAFRLLPDGENGVKNESEESNDKTPSAGVKKLIAALERGEVVGIKSGVTYRIAEKAKQMGLI